MNELTGRSGNLERFMLLNTLLIFPLEKYVNGFLGVLVAMHWNLGALVGSMEMLARVQR